MNPRPALMAWGTGDIYTLTIATVVFVLSCILHAKAIRALGLECADTLIGLMSGALSIGPLLMIVLDPVVKGLSLSTVDLLNVVLTESRLTLWFSAFLALINATISILRSRHPRKTGLMSIADTP